VNSVDLMIASVAVGPQSDVGDAQYRRLHSHPRPSA
jgi:hypothetical protein